MLSTSWDRLIYIVPLHEISTPIGVNEGYPKRSINSKKCYIKSLLRTRIVGVNVACVKLGGNP